MQIDKYSWCVEYVTLRTYLDIASLIDCPALAVKQINIIHRSTSKATCQIGKENHTDKFSSVWYKMDAAVDRLEVKIIQASGLKLVESGPPSSYAEVRIFATIRLYFSSKEHFWKTNLPTDFGVLSELHRSTFTDWPKNERRGHIK